jgi:hypothetical protein
MCIYINSVLQETKYYLTDAIKTNQVFIKNKQLLYKYSFYNSVQII